MNSIINNFKVIREYMKLWIAQTVSLVGTSMTRFAIMIWIWGEYDSAIPFALFFVYSAIASVVGVLINPLVLARTQNNEAALAIILTVAAIGGIVPGILIASIKGDFNKIYVMLGSIFLLGVGIFIMGAGRSVLVISTGAFFTYFFGLTAGICNSSFAQTKVRRDMLGRYMATGNFILGLGVPVLMIVSGPLIDNYFNVGITNPNSALYSLQWGSRG
ncbi:MAG: hypothetical protein LR001_08480 [Clostridiales bacterium]|nr:hypothetical protein [Clostridiales bacterium]